MQIVERCRYCGRLLKKESSIEAGAGEICLKMHKKDNAEEQNSAPEESLSDRSVCIREA